jgi:biopolymer transport protein ExbB/TolQ
MIRWLMSISPIAVMLAGALPALAVGWAVRDAKFQWFDRPSIIREATATADAACALRVTDAARRAEQAERARQQRVSAEALRIYREALSESQQQAEKAAQTLETEIADYEHQLAAQDRLCAITGSDLDFVYGRIPESSDRSR